ADALDQLLVRGPYFRWRLRYGSGEPHLEGNDMLRIETRIHGEQIADGAKKQTAGCEQDHREGDLRYNQSALRALMAARRTPASFLEPRLYVRTRALEGGQKAKHNADHHRDSKGEEEDRGIHSDVLHTRHASWSGGEHQ